MNAKAMSTLASYMGAEDKLQAIQLLLHQGVLAQSAREAMDRALEAGDEEQFLLAWHEIAGDQVQLAQLQQDAEFLDRITEKLPSATLERVKATIFRAGELELSSDELDTKLRSVVDAYLKQLDELDDYWVDDAIVMSALQGFDTEVRRLGDTLPIGVDKTLKHAQAMLARQYKALYGDSLKERLISGLQGSGSSPFL